MRKYFLLLIVVGTTLFSTQAMASEDSAEKEKMYLVQMINQLDALRPLIIAAQNEQPKNNRIQFHYTDYRDSSGKLHNGLLEDVTAIKQGLEEKLNQTSTEPHQFRAIKGDYINAR